MAKAWEIVERRSDGKWYTNMRTRINDEGIMYRNWVLAHDASRYAFREVDEMDAFLTSSASHMRQMDAKVSRGTGSYRMMDESKARRIGQELAASLVTLFETRPARDGGAQYALGRTLASMTGEFDDADLRDAFIEGVMTGFRQANAQIAAPRHEVNGDA